MPHYSDDLYLGPALGIQIPDPANPSPMPRGFGPLGRVYVFDVVPVAPGPALLAALQTTAGAADLVLTAGAGVTVSRDSMGINRYNLDTPRCVTLTSAANLSAINFTVYGYDQYGQPMSQQLAGPNANTVATLKAFKQVTRVAASAAVGSNVSVGFNSTLGLPVRVNDAGYIADPKWAGSLAQDAGAFVAAVATAPSALTGDVRGTYTPSSAADGVKRLVMAIFLTGIQVGPQATRLGLLGNDQA